MRGVAWRASAYNLGSGRQQRDEANQKSIRVLRGAACRDAEERVSLWLPRLPLLRLASRGWSGLER